MKAILKRGVRSMGGDCKTCLAAAVFLVLHNSPQVLRGRVLRGSEAGAAQEVPVIPELCRDESRDAHQLVDGGLYIPRDETFKDALLRFQGHRGTTLYFVGAISECG